MTFEVIMDRSGGPSEWRVEAIDRNGEGECYVAVFSGGFAEERAKEYAAWKNAGNGIDVLAEKDAQKTKEKT